jgi:hypothetical protein
MLAKTQDALAHTVLSTAVSEDPLLKQLVTQHLVVLAVAEAEDALEEIIVQYFHTTTTPAAKSLAQSCLSSLLRSVKTSEIAGFLNRLGLPFKESFQAEMRAVAPDESRFNNLVVNRHSIVHEAQCNITFEELRDSVVSVQKICEALRRSLSGA